MKRDDAELLGLLVQFLAARFASAMLRLVEEEPVGQKSDAAVAALDDAIDKIRAFQAAEDERDASVINERVAALQAVMAPAPGQPTDGLTGTPLPPDQTWTPGPTPTGVDL